MIKIRIQGTTNDIKWFLKILKRDKRFILNNPSELMDIKGTGKYKRVYTEVFRDEEDYHKTVKEAGPKKQNYYVGTGTIFARSN